jgi:hypothetical protein
MHCALCIRGKTIYSCSVCKVALCKTAKDKSHRHENCFTIWHKHADLIVEHHKIRAAYRQLKVNAGQNPKSDESSSDEHSEIPEDDDEEKEVIDGDTQSEEEERTPRRKLRSSAQQSNNGKKVRASAKKPKRKFLPKRQVTFPALSKNVKPAPKRELRARGRKKNIEEQIDKNRNKGVKAKTFDKKKPSPKRHLKATATTDTPEEEYRKSVLSRIKKGSSEPVDISAMANLSYIRKGNHQKGKGKIDAEDSNIDGLPETSL